MLVKCIKEFTDLESGRVKRTEGEQFEVTAERFAAINSTRYGQLVEAVEPEPVEEKPRRRTRKAEE